MFTNNVTDQVTADIQNWIVTFVEASNEFYGDKLPVCPYARTARLQNESRVHVYQHGSVRRFMEQHINKLKNSTEYSVILMVFPPRTKWYPGIFKFINNLNKKIIPDDLYALGGQAVGTKSKYPGWFNSGEYFVVGVNTLSNVLPAVDQLQTAGYYKDWSAEHYNAVVTRRQEMYCKYKTKDQL